MKSFGLALSLIALVNGSLVQAGPPSPAEVARQQQSTAEMKRGIAGAKSEKEKLEALTKFMEKESHPDMRRLGVVEATQLADAERDAFLAKVLAKDEDAGVRGLAATKLGLHGGKECLGALVVCAQSDKTTVRVIGCIASDGTAKREAILAIAELVTRFPKLMNDAVEKLDGLQTPGKAKDNEGLADARLQALYQITRKEELIKPFQERLQSKETAVRVQGVVAYRYLKLTKAPKELVALLKDKEQEVRSWCAMTLGEIRDAETIEALGEAASNAKEDAGVRFNAIYALGNMPAKEAAPLVRKLLGDPDMGIQTAAAIALFRLTGEKVKQYPMGLNTNPGK